MMPIKTKEFASLLVAAVAAIVVAAAMWLLEAVWWQTLCVACAVFVGMTLLTLFIIRKYVAYKLKPIYSIVLSRNVHTQEILDELKDKHVENISEELTAWADTNDKEIARLKETESFRKQYLGNVAHELKTPIFNIPTVGTRTGNDAGVSDIVGVGDIGTYVQPTAYLVVNVGTEARELARQVFLLVERVFHLTYKSSHQ